MAKSPTPTAKKSAKKSESKRQKATRVETKNGVQKLPTYGMVAQDQAQAAVAVAPRVNLDEMTKKIVNTVYYKHDHLTICVVEMENGFFLVGQSAPASIENFDEDIGCELAYEDCIKQLWRLEGYILKQKLHDERKAEEANKEKK